MWCAHGKTDRQTAELPELCNREAVNTQARLKRCMSEKLITNTLERCNPKESRRHGRHQGQKREQGHDGALNPMEKPRAFSWSCLSKKLMADTMAPLDRWSKKLLLPDCLLWFSVLFTESPNGRYEFVAGRKKSFPICVITEDCAREEFEVVTDDDEDDEVLCHCEAANTLEPEGVTECCGRRVVVVNPDMESWSSIGHRGIEVQLRGGGGRDLTVDVRMSGREVLPCDQRRPAEREATALA